MTVGSEKLRFWIDMTLECVRRDHTPNLSIGDQRGPFLTARAVGMALAALRDANHIAAGAAASKRLLTVTPPTALAGSNPIIAAAAACYQVLLLRYPRQARLLTAAWNRWRELHASVADLNSFDAGRSFGLAVHMIGTNDATIATTEAYKPAAFPPYVAYAHVAPPNEPQQAYRGSFWGGATRLLTALVPFAPPPNRIDATIVNSSDPHYASDFAKTASKGIGDRLAGTRTPEEELIGIFWGYDGPPELGTPPRLYMQVVLSILDAIEAARPGALDTSQELEIVAGTAVALADAGIDAWHYKYSPEHMMWRPIIGIREALPGNGKRDPHWLPLGRPDTNGAGQNLTPDFPAYPSGHATFGAAAFHLLRLYLVEHGVAHFDPDGTDNVAFDFVSDEFNGRNNEPRTQLPREHITRHHPSLWQAIKDNSLSRVYLGVHWQFDGITMKGASPHGVFGEPHTPADLGQIGGVWLGSQIATQVALKLGVSQNTISQSRM